MMVGPGHSFSALSEAIDLAFARWDLSHLHGFELADGRQIGWPEMEVDGPPWLDSTVVKVASAVSPGDEFEYTFDFGDNWHHRCQVLAEKVDPRVEYESPPPELPVPLWGWGWIPDQYGRTNYDWNDE